MRDVKVTLDVIAPTGSTLAFLTVEPSTGKVTVCVAGADCFIVPADELAKAARILQGTHQEEKGGL